MRDSRKKCRLGDACISKLKLHQKDCICISSKKLKELDLIEDVLFDLQNKENPEMELFKRLNFEN